MCFVSSIFVLFFFVISTSCHLLFLPVRKFELLFRLTIFIDTVSSVFLVLFSTVIMEWKSDRNGHL